MLKVENVTKYYGDNLAVDNLSFEVKEGEIFGLLGSNGAGKTTTFRIIMGLLDGTSGKVTLNGKNIDYSVTDEIGFVTEERSLLQKLTVKEQMLFYGTLKDMDEELILERLDYWLDRFGVSEYKDRKIKELSKGNQQKIQFISAILNEPKLLVLDEPFTGLDPINIEMFYEAILYFKKKGTSIIFSSHQMEFIERFCEKLIILVKGKTILDGYISDIKKAYRKKNIIIKGKLPKDVFKGVKGIISVDYKNKEYEVKIDSSEVTSKVFNLIKKYEITKFVEEEPSLNEIFIDKVGAAYEK